MGILHRTLIAVVVAIGLVPSVAIAGSVDGRWFLHPFGEMRAYFGDFLAVCDGAQFKRCRVVQYGFGPAVDGDLAETQDGFFGNSRLAIQQRPGANDDWVYNLEIFSTKLPDVPKGPMVLSIDGVVFQLSENDWQAGSPEGYNVSQSFSIVDHALAARLIETMKAGNRLRVLHDGWTETQFQLRGISRALKAIELRAAN